MINYQDVKEKRLKHGISQEKLAELTGLSRMAISNGERRNSRLMIGVKDVMERVFKEIENKGLAVQPVNTAAVERAPQGRLPKRKTENELIPFYDMDFAAGSIEFYNDLSNTEPDYYMDVPEFSGCKAFRVYGDSMQHLISNGNIFFAKQIEDWQSHLEYGQVYGIICNDERKYIKYIRKSQKREATHFLLRSENSKLYDDFELPKNKILSIWLVYGWLNKNAM